MSITITNKIGGKLTFTQWDVDRDMVICCPYETAMIHFWNPCLKRAIVVETEPYGKGKVICKVPNFILQFHEAFSATVFVEADGEKMSVFKQIYNVQPKAKPADYTYEENVRYVNWVEKEQQADELLQNIDELREEVKTEADRAEAALDDFKEGIERGEYIGPRGPRGISPIIGPNNNWFIWDDETETFTDTGQYSGGDAPYVGDNGNWFTGSIDTGVKAQGPRGAPGYTPQKGVDYFDGYTPQKGVDYFDGYTPVKGVDYVDGAPGHSPEVTATKTNGVTTVKVDGESIAAIVDGKNGSDASVTSTNVVAALGYSPKIGDYTASAAYAHINPAEALKLYRSNDTNIPAFQHGNIIHIPNGTNSGYGYHTYLIGSTDAYYFKALALSFYKDPTIITYANGTWSENKIMLDSIITYKDFQLGLKYDAGTIGTRGSQDSASVALSGYTPLGAAIVNAADSVSYIPVAFIHGSTVYLNRYRAQSYAVTSTAKETVRVTYIKT